MASTIEPVQSRAAIIRRVLIDLSVLAAIGLALALIAPFDSFRTPFAWRLVYWVTLSMTGYLCYSPLAALVLKVGVKLDLPEPALWVAAVLLGTIPMAIIVWIVGYLPGSVRLPTLEQAFEHYFYVLVIGAGITFIFSLLGRAQDIAAVPVGLAEPGLSAASESIGDDPEDAGSARFFARLPPHLGTELLALEMEDHYVRAHTAAGSDLILLRMRDAVAELDGLDGAQVHRSWWVARSAVKHTRRDGRNIRLELTGGMEAPVSRNAAPMLKEKGWW